MEKPCSKCAIKKQLSEFYRDKTLKDGHANICKKCKGASVYAWREDNRHKYNSDMRAYNKKHYHRLRLQRYKLLPEQYQAMLIAQNHGCKLCGKKAAGKRPLAIDHNHSTGQVRGLLCYGCNRAIAILDTPSLLKFAMAYLDSQTS